MTRISRDAMLNVSRLIGLAAELERLKSPAALWEGFSQAIARVGLTHHIYLTLAADRTQPDVVTNLRLDAAPLPPEEDPFLTYCCRSYEPTLTGVAHLGDYPYLSDAARGFIQSAAGQGFVSGLALPVRLRGAPRFGGFNLGSPLDKLTFAREILPLAPALHVLCFVVDRRHLELTAQGRTERQTLSPAGLTPRETDVLRLMADGLSRADCAEALGVSTNTVSTHLKSAFQKLGARNIVEASRKFSQRG